MAQRQVMFTNAKTCARVSVLPGGFLLWHEIDLLDLILHVYRHRTFVNKCSYLQT